MDLMHWRTNGILFRSKWEATSIASMKEGGWVVCEMVHDGKIKTRVFMAHLGFLSSGLILLNKIMQVHKIGGVFRHSVYEGFS